jgi:ureidoacrylate peracid hydrolase
VVIGKRAFAFPIHTIMVSDGNSTHTDAEHAATLASFYSVFGDVMDTETVIGCLRANVSCYAQAAE